jgi:hypothetical protein
LIGRTNHAAREVATFLMFDGKAEDQHGGVAPVPQALELGAIVPAEQAVQVRPSPPQRQSLRQRIKRQ